MNGASSIRKAAVLAAAFPAGIAVILAAVLLIAPAAHAAPATGNGRPVQFSDDGVTWSNNYTKALFGGVLLVPGGSADRALYVRNNAGEPAIMRVTLFDVVTTDTALADAMTVATSMPGNPGAAVPVTDARPCVTLAEGQILAAGDSVKVDNVAALADLNGTGGQARNVSFKLAISLSSTDSAAPAPNSCPTDYDTGTVVGAPDPGTGTTSHPVYHLGAGGWTPVPATASTPTATPSPAPTTTPGPAVRSLVANTQRLFQENFVAFWLAMAVVGALLLLVVRRRRRDDDASGLTTYPIQPTSQIGTGR